MVVHCCRMWVLFLSAVLGVELLDNPNLMTSGSDVLNWVENGLSGVTSSSAAGFSCVNLTGSSAGCPLFCPCPDLYQTFQSNAGQQYYFTCYGYSPTYGSTGGGFRLGLYLLNSATSYTCKSTLGSFTTAFLGDPDFTGNMWRQVQLGFTGTGQTMVLMIHSDNGRWGCFRNCSLNTVPPTTSPTRSPTTLSPTRNPTTLSPTTLAPTTCVLCNTPTCTNLEIMKDPEICAVVDDLDQVVGWTKSIADTAIARNVICSILKAESKQDCHHSLDRSLYQDACDTIRSTLYSGFLPAFNARWCANATENFTGTIDQWNSTLTVNYTTVSNQADCVETQQYQSSSSSSASSSTYAALGPLADVVAHPELYPNFPPIKVVHSSTRSTGILYNTACLSPQAVNPGWYGLLAVFLALAIAAGVLLYKRRHFSPVKARDPFLLWGSLFWVVVNFVWIAIDQLTGNTASCGLISFGNLVAFPMLLFLYLLRALRLVFLYKWAEGKVRNDMWFHSRRHWFRPRRYLGCSAVFFVICLVIFTASNVSDGMFTETFISSGRCDWWDINQQVIEAASEAGVPLRPTDFNPNGFVPYSVEYSSCVFCSTFATQVVMCVLTVLLLCCLVAALVLLGRINDQFKLLFELAGVLVALCAVAILRSVMFFPGVASSMMDSVGSDLGAIFLTIVLFFLVFVSAVYPAVLTYTRRFHVANKLVSSDGQLEGTNMSLSLLDVLKDPFGLDLYKRFSLESFAVENVMYWCAIQAFEQNKSPEVALAIYETYIRQGAVMEVNIDATLRARYDEMFGTSSVSTSVSASYSSSLSPKTAGSMLEMQKTGTSATAPEELPANVFNDVTQVVLGLMQTNCWLRFQKSPFWDLLKEEMQRRNNNNPIDSHVASLRSVHSQNSRPNTMKSKSSSSRLDQW